MIIDPKKIIFADLDISEAVVLNLDTKNYYRLNETGQVIWKRLENNQSPPEIADFLSESYDISREAALKDVYELIDNLKAEQLISQEAKATPSFSIHDAHTSKLNKQPI
ncbi:MAG: PqqD family protein [Bdellovibrionales bacterium]|nr:PqqD family protein [Bdellovibrionales bacterium]